MYAFLLRVSFEERMRERESTLEHQQWGGDAEIRVLLVP